MKEDGMQKNVEVSLRYTKRNFGILERWNINLKLIFGNEETLLRDEDMHLREEVTLLRDEEK